MNRFTSFFSRKQLEASFGVLRSRFLLPTLILLVLAGFLFYMVNVDVPAQDFWITRVILSCIVTFFLSTGVILSLEGEKKSKYVPLFMILPVVYGIVFYLTVDSTTDWGVESMSYFLLHLTGFLSFLFFAPYISRIQSKETESIEYTNYFSRIAWVFLMSCIVGGALIALGFIAIASVIALFDISHDLLDESKLYGNWAVIALSLIAPLYGLIAIPHKQDIDQKSYEINRFFSFLIRYVAVPFIFIYFLILYAYSAKVLMNFQDWPREMISRMVIGFSIFGYLSYIFSKPYEEESDTIHIFRKFFPIAVIPQIAMLAYAIWLRIAQYDLTMNRYFVVIFGFWLFIISLYLILSKKKSLAIITASLTLISLLISVGPWSVYSVPLNRQYARLVRNLEVAGILQDGKVTRLTHSIDTTLENDIYSEIQYVCDFSECTRIKQLFANELRIKEQEDKKNWESQSYNSGKVYPGMYKWSIVDAVTTAIGVSYHYGDAANDVTTKKYKSYMTRDVYNIDSLYPLDTSGYDRLIRVYGNEYGFGTSQPIEYITINPDDERMILHKGSGAVVFSVHGFNTDIQKRYLNLDNNNLDQKDLTFMTSTGGVTLKLMMQNYSIKNPNYKATQTTYDGYGISGYALVKGGK